MHDFLDDLENDLEWRRGELASLKVSLARSEEGSVKRTALLRALIVMLYAHYQGFCKFSWEYYLCEIKKQGVKRVHCTKQIAVFSLKKEFNKVKGGANSDELWKFIHTKFHALMNEIPEFEILPDAKSNLWPDLLKTNLEQLGIYCSTLDVNSNKLSSLVNRRNSIAHGQKELVKEIDDYELLEKAVFDILYDICLSMAECLSQKTYLIPFPR